MEPIWHIPGFGTRNGVTLPRWGRAGVLGGLVFGAVAASAQQTPPPDPLHARSPRPPRHASELVRAWTSPSARAVLTPPCGAVSTLGREVAEQVNLVGTPCLLEGREVAAARTLREIHGALRSGGALVVVTPWDEDDHFGGQSPLLLPRAMPPGTLRSVASPWFRVVSTEQTVMADGAPAYAMRLVPR